MKEKYGDQDAEERAARLQLLGAKDVSGFSIEMHAERKHGSLLTGAEEKNDESEGDLVDNGDLEVVAEGNEAMPELDEVTT